jgi:hypothetical protein
LLKHVDGPAIVMPKRPLSLRELLQRLKPYGIKILSDRGKGSEIILLKPISADSRKGPQYSVKNHGPSTEITVPVINSILRRFGIEKDAFWN